MADRDEFNDSLGEQPDRREDEQRFPGGQPADRVLETSLRDRAIVEDSIRGLRILALAEKYRLSGRQVSRILKDAALAARDRTQEIVAETFFKQVERLEKMFERVEMEMQAYEDYMRAVRAAQGGNPGVNVIPVKFDDRPFRVAVMIMDRQAKLLGMDRGAGHDPRRGPADWLDGAPIEQVVDYAKQLKMKIPSEFET